LVSDWTNQFGALDVSRDGAISPVDALIGINELNDPTIIGGERQLPDRLGFEALPFYDVNGDLFLTPLDILIVFNALNEGFIVPTIDVGLSEDTGPGGVSNEDLLTSNPDIVGQLTQTKSNVTRITAQVDGGSRVDVMVAPSGAFSFATPLPLNGSADGVHTLRFTSFDDVVILSAKEITLTLDTVGPQVVSSLPTTVRQTFDSLSLQFIELRGISGAAFEPATYSLSVVGGANNGESVPLASATQLNTATARLALHATLPDQSYRLTVSPALTDLAGNALTGPTAFDFTVADPTGIREITPSNGEQLVSVTRETIVRFDEPVDPTTVTADALKLIALGQELSGRIIVSSTERFVTFFYDDPLPASTQVRVKVDGNRIMGRDGLPLDADGDNEPGGFATADFSTLPLTRIAETGLFGYVYDAANVIPQESLPIPVPTGDPHFDPMSTGSKTIPFTRAVVEPGTGTSAANPRQFLNNVTSFIDASMVYGSNEVRARALRTLDGTGHLKTSAGDNLPRNDAETFPNGLVEMANEGPMPNSMMPVAGDVRAGEVPTLTAMHTLWLREHNRYADEVKAAHPRWTDDQIYEAARRWVGALIQQITYQEFLPAILGANPLPAYTSYDSGVDPSISALFSTAAYRLGHTLQSGSIQRLDANGQSLPGGPLLIRNAFFNPNPLRDDGLDAYLRGMAAGRAQEFDMQVIDDLRNFLFGPPDAGGLDLVSMNIQRGRDLGLPSYNQAREDRGLARVTTFAEITSNATAATALQAIYGDVNKIDVWVGGLAEDHVAGATVGPLFAAIIQDQFLRSRDGDRFWYENGQFSDEELTAIRSTMLSSVIARNSGVTGLPANVFTINPANAGPGAGGSSGTSTELRSFDGYGNNETQQHLGEANWPLRTDYTVGFGDGIGTPGGADRPNPRAISNALAAQSSNSINSAGLTDLAITWGQFLDHDLDLTPSQSKEGTNIPVVGATIRIDAFPEANAVTDAHGFFELENMPAPEFFVHIDGTTATNAPAGRMYPSVGKPFHSVPGQRIQLNMAGVPFNVYLPPMATADITPLSNSQPTDVGFGDAGMDQLEGMFPNIDANEWSKVQVTFAPGAAVDSHGTAATQAVIIPVPPSRLPAPLPPGVDPQLVISIQAPGATNFDIPAPITFPNLDHLPLGEHAALFSFDHDIGMFVPTGTMEVVDDGNGGTILVSDPGVGIVAPGWHYITPPLNWSGAGGKPEGNQRVIQENPPEIDVRLFVTGDVDTLGFTFTPPPGPGQRIGDHPAPGGPVEPTRTIEISIAGPFDKFYDNTGANGLRATTGPIVLKPGNAAITRTATLRSLAQLLAHNNAGKPFDQDVLYGAKITVKDTLTLADGSRIQNTRIVVPYLLADQSDEKGDDKLLKFRNTVSEDTVTSRRAIDLETSGAGIPFFEFAGPASGDYSDDIDGIEFDPSAVGDRVAQLRIRTTVNGQTVRSANTLPIQGKGTERTTIYLNQAGYRTIATTHDGLTVAQADTNYADMKTRAQARLDEIGGEIAHALVLSDAATGDDPKVVVTWNFADNECVGATGPADAMGNPTFQAGDCRVNANGTISFIDSNMNGMLDPAEFNDSNGNGMVDSDNDLGIASEVDFVTTDFATNLATAANRTQFGKSQQVFLLDSYFNGNDSASFVIYSDNHLGFPFSAGDPTGPEVLGDTVAHEGGHTFGLPHSNNMGIAPAGGEDIMHHNAIQNLSITQASQFAFLMALDAGATVDDVFMHTLPAYLRGYTNRANPPHDPFPRIRPGTELDLYTGPPPEGTATVRNERFGDGQTYEPVGPLFALVRADNGFAIYDQLDFGRAIADGTGGSLVSVPVVIRNLGEENLVVDDLSFANGTRGFSVSGFTPGTVAPLGALPLTLTFDPLAVGRLTDTLRIDTNTDGNFPADANGVIPIELVGLSLVSTSVIKVTLSDGNNNCGGVAVGENFVCGGELTVTNDGGTNLVFTPRVVEGTGDFDLGSANGVQQTLPSGASMQLPVTFRPSKRGLLPGLVRLTTNDPMRQTIDQGFVGTGVPAGGIGGGDFDWGRDYVHATSGLVAHRAVSDAAGFFQFGLSVDSDYTIAAFDPVSGYLAQGAGTTGPSGAFTDITRSLTFHADTSPDSDFDGLPDNSELAIGSSVNRRDTDGDGLTDFFEIQQGLDPLGALRLPTGVVTNLNLPGQANALAVADDLIYVATGFHGLAIINGSRFDNPILLGQLDLPGNATGIDVDQNLQIAAVATGQGLALVDVSDPMQPVLFRTVPINAQRVLVHNGVAYAAVRADVAVVDLNTGEVLQTLDLPLSFGDITGMARDGLHLFTHTEGLDTLRVIDISIHDNIRVVGEVSVPIASGNVGLHAGNGFVWLAGSGLNSVDVSDPEHPVRVGQPSGAGFFSARRIALNGSGLGVLAPDFSNKIEVYDVSDPTVVNGKVQEFPLSGSALDVAVSRGLAYVGNGNQLSVVNYLPFDNAGEPPTVSISTPTSDEDPNRSGLQILEGTSIPIRVDATDDVQIRQVELLVNGEQQEVDVSFPFDFSLIVPKLAADAPTSIVVRAVDTGGNTATSQPLLIDVVGDIFPPTLSSVTPSDGSVRGELFRTVRVTFSEAIDPATLTADNIRLSSVAAPNAVLVPTNVQIRDRGRTVQFTYDRIPPGENQLVLQASAIHDFAGNALGAADIVNRFTVLDATALWLNPAGGNWDDAANWEGNQLPGPDDHVLINVPDNVTITHRSGDTHIKSLTSNNKVTLSGGTLDVETFVEVRNTFTLVGGTLANATLTRRADLPGVVVAPNADVELDRVTLDNNLRIANGADVIVTNGLTLNGTLTIFNEGAATDLAFNGTQTISGTGRVVLAGTSNSNRSRILTNADETLTIGTGITLQADVGSQLGLAGSIVNAGTIVANAGNGTSNIFASLDNQGTLDVRAGRLNVAAVTNLLAGTLLGGVWRVAGNATLELTGANIVTLLAQVVIDGVNSRLLNSASGSALAGLNTIGPAGQLLLLNGQILNATGDVTNNGQLTIGSGSRLNVGGAFQQADDATLTIGVSGTTALGSVAVTGAATLDGDLNLSILSGVDVQLSTLTPLTFGSRTGEFDAINGTPAGLLFQPEYRPQRVLLHFGAALNQLAALPFTATFNDGTLGDSTLTRSNANGRVSVTSANLPRTGGRHLVLDAPGAGLATNEYIIALAIDAVTPLQLSFYHRSFDTTADPLPAMFTGSIGCDGVALSVDGLTWYRVADLSTATSPTYEQFIFDLRAVATAAGVTLTDRLLLKFQQVGGYLTSANDGRAFDDIRIGADAVGPRIVSLTPAGPFVFASDVSQLAVVFNEPLDPASATNVANFRLVGDGNDNLFGTSDDRTVIVTPDFDGSTTVTLRASAGLPLADDSYRLTLSGTGTIADAAGVPLLDGLDSVTFFTVFAPESPTNDTLGTATVTGLTAAGGQFNSQAASGNHAAAGADLDLYRFTAGAGQFVRATATTVAVPGATSPLDLRIRVLDDSGTELATANAANSDDAALSFRLPANGDYFIEVASAAGNPGLYKFSVNLGGNVAGFPLNEDFQAGPPLAAFWESSSTTSGRIRVIDTLDHHGGDFLLVGDTNTPVDPWLLVHQNVPGPNTALTKMGLIQNVDYTVATAGDFAFLTAAQIAAFDVVMVTTPSTDFGLLDDADNNSQSDLLEALSGVGTTGRALLTTLDADTSSLPNGQERELLRNALNWLRAGQTTSLLAMADPDFHWQWTPWAADLDTHIVNASDNDVSIVPAANGHDVLTGISSAGLSNWLPSYTQFVDDDVPGFTTLAVDASDATRRVALALDGAGKTLPTEDRRPSLHEAILHIDLDGVANAELRFDAELLDQLEDLTEVPAMFTGSVNATGVSLSIDGVNWFSLFPQEGFLHELRFHGDDLAIDLDEFATANNLQFTDDVKIKFQYFGFGPAPFRGITLDNIQIDIDRIGPAVAFVNPLSFAPHTRPVAVATGDLNGDGVPDIVTANSGFGGAVSIFLNSPGGPMLTEHLPLVAARDVALGDLDGDTDLDLVAIVVEQDTSAPRLVILYNDGAGMFGNQFELGLSFGAADVVLGDLNGDSRLDAVVANGSDGGNQSATLLFNDGAGRVIAPIFLNLPILPKALALGDLDGDTRLDLAIVGSDGTNSRLASFLNVLHTGQGTFRPASMIGVGGGAMDVVLGDLNGDSLLDAVTAGFDVVDQGRVSVRFGEAGGLFGGGAEFGLAPQVHAIALGMLDADSDLDIVALTRDANGASGATVMLNDGTGMFPSLLAFPTGADSGSVVLADVNGDSRPDVITASGESSSQFTREVGNLLILTNAGGGALTPGQALKRDDIEFPQGFITVDDFLIGFDEVGLMDPATLANMANFRLVEAGADGQFDPANDPTPDDRVVSLLTPVVVTTPNSTQQVRLTIAASELPLPEGKYRLTVKGTGSVRDAEGNPLDDLDGDGTGADFDQVFEILNNGPVIDSQFPRFDAGLAISELTLRFSKPIDADSFTLDDITTFNGPGGPIAPTSVAVVGDSATIHFPTQTTRGFYFLQVGPDISDLDGNLMNPNFNATFGEPFADASQRFFEVSLSQFDENQFVYDWSSDNATIQDGGRFSSDPQEDRFGAYNTAFVLTVGGADYAGLTGEPAVEDNRQTIVFPTKTLAGLEVHREVYVPATGGNFARLLDVLHNPTGTPIMVPVTLSGDLGGLSPLSVTASSSGDATLTTADNWFASDDAPAAGFAPELAFVLQDGTGIVSVADADFDSAQFQFGWSFNLTVGAGETIRLLSFAVQTSGRAAAAAEAADLVTLPARAKANLSESELASIVNFATGVSSLRLAHGYGDYSGGPRGDSATAAGALTAAELQQTLATAISWWIAAGLDDARAEWLSAIDVRIDDLSGNLLAIADTRYVVVDFNAAGAGWHVAAPTANEDAVPADQVDLLTALSHELGHLLGLKHVDSADSLMSESLARGLRRRPWAELVDELFAQE
jgi:hypothetical protein